MTASTIMKRELKAYFTSPVAYLVSVLFLVVSGIFFYFGFMPFYGGWLCRYFHLFFLTVLFDFSFRLLF